MVEIGGSGSAVVAENEDGRGGEVIGSRDQRSEEASRVVEDRLGATVEDLHTVVHRSKSGGGVLDTGLLD
ncbi:hypothetical protein ACSBR2_036652 [Camellia fascicularis]